MTTFDLSPLWRSSVGFDEFDRLFDSVFSTNNKGASYPPYNIVKHDKNIYQITMAIAGFDQNQIKIKKRNNQIDKELFKNIKEDKNRLINPFRENVK